MKEPGMPTLKIKRDPVRDGPKYRESGDRSAIYEQALRFES